MSGSEKINVLLLGSGGREHAMSWAIGRSPLLDTLYTAPGNPGTAQEGVNTALALDDFDEILRFIEEHQVDLTVVGPEQPLVDGITDFLEDKGHPVFGPSKQAAMLEGSKKFANDFMKRNQIPTADYQAFSAEELDSALAYIRQKDDYPVVLKADGLAGGKGVFICETEREVEECLAQFRDNSRLGEAAETLVVEEFMRGEEVSVFVISDGEVAKVIHYAQDHKRIGEGDTGPNTGGMGAYCPAPVMNPELLGRVEKEIILPTVTALLMDGTPYRGILYCGLMITEDGPKVVEYNCRFGDPECQAIVPALETDLLELMQAAAVGGLDEIDIAVDPRYYCCVVMASEGYPGQYEKGFPISGLDNISPEAWVFHAGTARKDGQTITAGGRVLSVVAAGDTLRDAITNTYAEVDKISFENACYRGDIGAKGLRRLE